ncbi:MAG TPA: molybdopterin-dependent oxidoreductase [Saliniramus sp.]|nr:molybdopterin-dependent oxidoreductase [Saliniramus sp.]
MSVLVFPPTTALGSDAAPLAAPSGEVLLRISGEIDNANVGDEAHFDRAMIEELPARRLDTSTVVTDGVQSFDGVLMRDLLAAAGARGDTVSARALNDYTIDIPVGDFSDFDVVLALRMNGEELTARDKGPLWIVYPRDDFAELRDIRYDYRWVWQLIHLEVQ